MSYRRLILETKAKIFVKTEWLRYRFLESNKKMTQSIAQEFFKKWETEIFDVITAELVEKVTSSEELQREFIDIKLSQLEDEDFDFQEITDED